MSSPGAASAAENDQPLYVPVAPSDGAEPGPSTPAISSHHADACDDKHLVLALSGGGVRSAALSSGVLCFLKEVGLIHKTTVCVVCCVLWPCCACVQVHWLSSRNTQHAHTDDFLRERRRLRWRSLRELVEDQRRGACWRVAASQHG